MRYAVRKVLTTLITLLAVSFFVFLAFALISGDPATAMLGIRATPERLLALRQELGLDRPFPVRYAKWLAAFAAGDMGISYSYRIPVRELVADKLPITLTLTLLASVMTVLLSLPLGIYTAKHAGRPADRIIMAVNQAVMAIPPFFAGMMLTLVFGLLLRLFTPGGYISYRDDLPGFAGYLIAPAFAMALPKIAMSVKLLRGAVLAEAGADYVRTAYSKGNSTNQVLYGHVLKNAMIPLITFWGMALADMMAGSIIIEQVFGIPGLGRILLSSIANRDYPVVMAVILWIAFFVLMANMAVDLLYGRLDPRTRDIKKI
jgi:peptide/nickel transport system permease protein